MAVTEHLPAFAPTVAGLERAAAALRGLLDSRSVSGAPRYNVELAFDEIAANVVRHAHATGDVGVEVRFDDDEITLTFEDDGTPFNPCDRPPAPLPSSIEQARIGGLGLPLLSTFLTRMHYERTPQQHNRLTVGVPARDA